MAQKPKDIRAMKAEDRQKALTEARAELMHQRGLSAMGGAVKNPGLIGDLRTTIARILTIQNEEARAARGRRPRPAPAKAPAKGAAKAGAKGAKPAAKPAKPAKAPKAKAAKGAKPEGGAR